MRVVRLGGRGVHTQSSVPYARMCVPCPLNVILTRHCLRERPRASVPRPPEVKMSFIGRRVREPLDHLHVQGLTGTQVRRQKQGRARLPGPAIQLLSGGENFSRRQEAEHV
jgi:hypothetical protein